MSGSAGLACDRQPPGARRHHRIRPPMSHRFPTRSRRAGGACGAKGMTAPSAGDSRAVGRCRPGWVRPVAARTRPDRHFGGYYRSADPQVVARPARRAADPGCRGWPRCMGLRHRRRRSNAGCASGAAARRRRAPGQQPGRCAGAPPGGWSRRPLAVLEWMEGAAASPERSAPAGRRRARLLARLWGSRPTQAGPVGGAAGPAPSAAAAAAPENQSSRGALPGPQASGGSDRPWSGHGRSRCLDAAPHQHRPAAAGGRCVVVSTTRPDASPGNSRRCTSIATRLGRRATAGARAGLGPRAATLTLEVGAATPRAAGWPGSTTRRMCSAAIERSLIQRTPPPSAMGALEPPFTPEAPAQLVQQVLADYGGWRA